MASGGKSSVRKYSDKFKLDLIRENLDGGVPIARLARAHGVSDSQLRKWKRAYLQHGAEGVRPKKQGRPSKAEDRIAEMAARIRSLNERIRALEEENAALRKLQDFLRGGEPGGLS